MYAIIATFDCVFTNKIRELQNELTNIIGTNPLAGVEPHITLADYNELDVNLYTEKLEEFVVFQENIAAVTFPTNRTIFLAPTITDELLRLHHSYHDYFKVFHDNLQSYYVPGKWIPHCTIANGLNSNQFLSVMEYIYEKFDVTIASIEKLKLIKVNYEDGFAISSSILAEYNLKRMETSR
ncbi:2'-5' RNA ligase family protein [Bacillus mycoides]|uniref:2'-5' RNA ligase family protein n=1 Tax=Bacillus mycoides TaxID=1405 RepID=UPI0028535097|nr:2'-5' RNA ligase family protein [Bacillus mycoides]MDR4901468.1 2'-5' RNA ligase family protein [Bacillus mycoides]MED1012837.1 2'-5' RNA ligase family protein [Bacillus mycoides]MED1046434.1 2'-5' RNA ligase family protein [Bacillus mycoides]MED1051311.1 2'-5' RNA ligase family protein [Bacillus mycoides]MED1084429.1 2'-5' RNA ligase family protein [Bacillus mycoides]